MYAATDKYTNNIEGEVYMNNPFNEKNFKIQVLDNSFVVRSDSDRFGTNEIVFQGISYAECLDYIEERTGNIPCTYYVIKDLASWRRDVWDVPPERSLVERFDTVDAAIQKFNEYKGMDYLKQEVINPDNSLPMRRLVLGVSHPTHMAELDLLHTESSKTLLISDIVGERKDGFAGFMVSNNFIRDLNKIISMISIDEYSYYREKSMEEFASERLAFLNEHYPEEIHTMQEAIQVAKEFLRHRPDYLKNNKINDRIPFDKFQPPYLENSSAKNELIKNYESEVRPAIKRKAR